MPGSGIETTKDTKITKDENCCPELRALNVSSWAHFAFFEVNLLRPGVGTAKVAKSAKIGSLVSACERAALLSFATFVSLVVNPCRLDDPCAVYADTRTLKARPGFGIGTAKATKSAKIGSLVSACERSALLSFATFVSFVVKHTVNIHPPAAVRA